MVEFFSTNSHYTLDSHSSTQHSPFLHLVIFKAIKLSQLIQSNLLNPYISIQRGKDRWRSKLGIQHRDIYEWNQSFQIELHSPSPIYLIIYNKQQFGDNSVISSMFFSPKTFQSWKDKKEIWLRLPYPPQSVQDEIDPFLQAVPVTDNLMESENDRCPLLHLQIEYLDAQALNRMRVRVGSHRNVIFRREYFTQYELVVERNDGISWKVKIRFSEILRVRNELIKILPALRNINFPGKTYFNWMSCVCQRFSKFDQQLIDDRKKGIQEFLNQVLENMNVIYCESLNELLKIKF